METSSGVNTAGSNPSIDFDRWTNGEEDLKEIQEALRLIIVTNGKINPRKRAEFWRIANHLAWRTKLIKIEKDFDVSVEPGDDGEPYLDGGEFPVSVTILDIEKLTRFSEYVNVKVERLDSAIAATFATKSKIKWRCPECGHFMVAFEKRRQRKLEKMLLGTIDGLHCKKCRKMSWPFIINGRIRFHQVVQVPRKEGELQNNTDEVPF